MKPTQEQIEDRLMDALLHEQSRADRETALQEIENAIDRGGIPVSETVSSPWRMRLGIIAACIVVSCSLVIGHGALQKSREATQLQARTASALKVEDHKKELADLDRSIREQEDKVEERRKLLATIVRTKGAISNGLDPTAGVAPTGSGISEEPKVREEAIARSIANEDRFDAVLEFGRDSKLLADMKKKAGQDPSKVEAVDVSSIMSGIGGADAFADVASDPPKETQSNSERYGSLVDPGWQKPVETPLSTFSIDVDNASYSNVRRFIREGRTVPPDAVRIEECVNAFDYNYTQPAGKDAFSVHANLATCPWNDRHLLVKIGIKGREISAQQRPVSNLVFLIDVSGSMQNANKLPLVKESLRLLLHQLDERDSVSYVVYAGHEGVVLPATKMTESGQVIALDALEKLEAGGSTDGGSGIKRAYQIAKENFIKEGVNRVILASDGDFNVGVTDTKELVELVKERARDNIYLTVLSFGAGNLNDAMLESISKDGNGNYYYIDSIREARKVFLQRLQGTLVTIAKDVKIQVEFNPAKVGFYRLIGYANRVLRDEDFNNDKVDAGDIGAGHTVTAFYEIVPSGSPQPGDGAVDPLKYQKSSKIEPPATALDSTDEWLTLKLRHKSPEGDTSSLQETVVKGPVARWQDSGGDFSFASAVALFGMKLRGMDEAKGITWNNIRELAAPGLKDDRHENRSEFMGLLEALENRDR